MWLRCPRCKDEVHDTSLYFDQRTPYFHCSKCEEETKIENLKFEMNDNGCIRIIGEVEGEWAPYTGIATYRDEGNKYIAVSDYFSGSLPTEKVLRISEF